MDNKKYLQRILLLFFAHSSKPNYLHADEIEQTFKMSVDRSRMFNHSAKGFVSFSAKTTNDMMKNLFSMKKLLIAACTIFIFSQCTEEEIVPTETQAASVESTPASAAPTGSMTISGVYTVYESVADCSTCTFVVPEDLGVVDGKELNLKPGSVICLDKAITYGDIDFVNLEGTEEHPIRIGACGAH